MQRTRLGPHRTALLCLSLALGGCATTDGSDAPQPTAAPSRSVVVDADDVAPARLAPLAGLPACPSPPPGGGDADVGDLPVPPAAVVTAASEDGGLRNVQGYSQRTPVEIMVAYLELEDWTVLTAEDEVFESEVLLERDGLRVFAKAQATCDRGSLFVLFGSTDEALVPRPAGTSP